MIKTIRILVVISAALLGLSWFMKDKYPDSRAILKEIIPEPIQTKTDKPEFEVKKGGVTYQIKPLFDYELKGMVVTYNHSNSWTDADHRTWKDYINVEDICVIWGDNVRGNLYKDFKFSSGSWMCSFYTRDLDSYNAFDVTKLSNNHILVADKKLQKLILSVRRGDQIYMKGYLVDYSHGDGFARNTSITREDTGVGACEIVFVTDFKVLKRANVLWRALFTCSMCLGAALLVAWFVLAWKGPARNKD